MRTFLPLLVLVTFGCIHAEGDPAREPVVAPSEDDAFDDELVEFRRAITRAQFEAAQHGSTTHLAFGCPQCADPMRGKVPDEALLDGPADVWN